MTAQGIQFVGIDDEAFGNGIADTQTMDTWLQNRIASNIAACAQLEGLGRQRCLPPFITNADDFATLIGIRPYPAINWQTVWIGWILVPRGANAMRFSFAYQSDVPGAVNAGTRAGTNQLRILLGDETETVENLAWTYSAGRLTGFHSATMSLREPQALDTVTTCVIQVKANNDQADVATSHGILGTGVTTNCEHHLPYVHVDLDGGTPYWHPNQAAPGPEANSFEAMYYGELGGTAYENSPSGNRLEHDIILSENNPGAGNSKAVMVGLLGEPIQALQSGNTRLSQCFFLRSMSYSPLFTISGEKAFQPDRLVPNVEFGGSEASTQAVWTTELLRGWRVASYGPRGRKADGVVGGHDLSVIANYEYAVHWPIVKGDYEGSAAKSLTTGNLTFTNGPENINRASGSWITDGATVGSRIVIVGGTNPGVWTVSGGITASNVNVVETLVAAGPEAVTSVDMFIAGEESNVIDDAFYLTTENPQLELRCLWLMVQHGASNVNVDLFDDNRREKDSNRGNIAEKFAIQNTSSSLGACLWKMNAKIQQMDDLVAGGATWDLNSTIYGALSDVTVNLDVWPSNAQANTEDWPPVLRGSDFMEIGGKGTPSFGTFWYKEGSLFLDHGDNVDGLLQPTIHQIDVTNTTSVETARPFRLNVTMDLLDFADPLRDDFTAIDDLNATARLMLVGYQLLELPRIT